MGENNTSSKKAIAMEYNPEKDQAPRVTAIGKGLVADQIIALARSRNIPIHHDPYLVDSLAEVDFGGYIPPDLYTVVAEILAFIYRINQKKVTIR